MDLLAIRKCLTPTISHFANCQRLNYFFFKRSLFFPIASFKKSFYGLRTINEKTCEQHRDQAEAEAL